jgi:hypothetical protein
MIQASSIRFLAVISGLSASLSASAVSLVHGHSHSEATEHSAHHHAASAGANRNHAPDHETVDADDHDRDHGHPRLEPAAFTRAVKDLPAIQASPITIELADVAHRETRDAPEPNESPPDRPDVSPAQSRAPPAL